MQCNKIFQHIDGQISDKEFEIHAKECSYCNEMDNHINDVFSLLDAQAEVPQGMVAKILQKKNELPVKFSLKRDFAIILQIACVAIAGIFIGIILGKNSNPNILMSKNTERTKTLIEYKNSHHFTVDSDFF